jgi:hypothetical protein
LPVTSTQSYAAGGICWRHGNDFFAGFWAALGQKTGRSDRHFSSPTLDMTVDCGQAEFGAANIAFGSRPWPIANETSITKTAISGLATDRREDHPPRLGASAKQKTVFQNGWVESSAFFRRLYVKEKLPGYIEPAPPGRPDSGALATSRLGV